MKRGGQIIAILCQKFTDYKAILVQRRDMHAPVIDAAVGGTQNGRHLQRIKGFKKLSAVKAAGAMGLELHLQQRTEGPQTMTSSTLTDFMLERSKKRIRAYGPKYVHKLARLNPSS